MKKGLTLAEWAQELERQAAAKADYVADSTRLRVTGNAEALVVEGHGEFPMRETAHEQLAERLGIPRKFYDRLRLDHPDLISYTANALLAREPEKRLVRTMDGQARGILSPRYRRLDNLPLAQAILPVFAGHHGIEVQSAQITERRMYLKVTSSSMVAEVRGKGDVVAAGVVISNSEIGYGAERVEPLLLTLACLNGAVINEWANRAVHVGRQIQVEDDAAAELFSDEALEADDRAHYLKLRDVVGATFSRTTFEAAVARARKAAGVPIEAPVPEVVERLAQRYALPEATGRSILDHLTRGGDLTQWGLVNAVTAAAQDDDLDYEQASELEALGGQVMVMPAGEATVLLARVQ